MHVVNLVKLHVVNVNVLNGPGNVVCCERDDFVRATALGSCDRYCMVFNPLLLFSVSVRPAFLKLRLSVLTRRKH